MPYTAKAIDPSIVFQDPDDMTPVPDLAFPDPDAMIAANGGAGAFETDETSTEIERWLFPRFDPTCPKCGTKAKQDDNGKYLCAKCKKPVKMDERDMYLSRSGIGPYDSDVETLAGWLAAPRNVVGAILLLGDPGTGKTALIEAAVTYADRTLTTIVCTPDHTKDSLFLRFMGEGRGEDGTPFGLGPLPYAVKHGHTLYMDETMLLVDGLKPILYSLADGRRFLPEGNVDGSPLEVHPNFRLVLSSNPLVRGASLPEPLASRCAGTTLHVETSSDMLIALNIDDAVVGAWEALGQAGLWRPAIRELRVADYWMGIDVTQAVSAFLPEHCPESQRDAVRAMVVSYLGGDIRDDGRLVVA